MYNGRWCYGDKLWQDYQEIGNDLSQRTSDIQFKRGLGINPDLLHVGDSDLEAMLISQDGKTKLLDNEVFEDDEPDINNFHYIDSQNTQNVNSLLI